MPAKGDQDSKQLEIHDVGIFKFKAESSNDRTQIPDGLSGITYIGNNQYLAVSDNHAYLHKLTIEIDHSTGSIITASFKKPLALTDISGTAFPEPAQGQDREGIIYDQSTDTVWISNERTGTDKSAPSIAQHSLETGKLLKLITPSSHPQLGIFSKIRSNLGFEGIARAPDGSSIWTANEEALSVDGGRPSQDHGTVIRLQQFDKTLHPSAQYAYTCDAISPPVTSPPNMARLKLSGVADLLSPAKGILLTLERAIVGDSTGRLVIRNRIYEVDVSNATDISRPPWSTGLLATGEPFNTVKKRLLFELFGSSNFEGLTIGPRLDNGDYAVVLICDNGDGLEQTLYALRLRGL